MLIAALHALQVKKAFKEHKGIHGSLDGICQQEEQVCSGYAMGGVVLEYCVTMVATCSRSLLMLLQHAGGTAHCKHMMMPMLYGCAFVLAVCYLQSCAQASFPYKHGKARCVREHAL
jgi:hypothetical protein